MPTARAAPHSDQTALDKAAMRARMRRLRSACDPAAGVQLAGHVLAALAPAPGLAVAGYWPLAGEIDVRPLLLALAGSGHVVALPETLAPGSALVFHRWRPGAALLGGRFGTLHPAPDLVTPDVILAPLLAFDRCGRRLGYGGGYYDRTMAGLPATRVIGCGFAVQEVEQVPAEIHDLRLSAVATEAGILRIGGARV